MRSTLEQLVEAEYISMARFGYLRFNLLTNPTLTYLPALDGLRAFAILTVMLNHLKTKPLFPGGNIGVDLFFVLSGFLITALLVQEWAGAGSISLKRFYLRRALRLLPAAATFVGVYVTVSIVFRNSEFSGEAPVDSVLRNAGFVAIYCFNWLRAIDGTSGLGLGHLWSLSVEEQFYFVWPLALLLLLKARVPAAAMMLVTTVLLLLSASLPAFLPGDWGRFYFGTDFRMQSLLMGSLLAQLYVAGVVRVYVTHTILFRFFLIASILVHGTIVLGVTNDSAFLFLGGHTFVAICCGVLVTGAMFESGTIFAKTLSNSVLVYIGKRSYAVYLWHFAIGFWLRSLEPFSQIAATLLISFLAAELSHRLVEAPALRLKSRLRTSSRATLKSTPVAASELNTGTAA
jgi:peptidoglycan/LPS O-acetylase OafA/YrhL